MGALRWSVVHPLLDQEPAASHILEVGCGQGAVGARLASRFGSYTGVEPDVVSAEVAAARVGPYGGRVVANLTEVAPDEPVEILCAFEVLEHIEDDSAALRSWVDRSSPGALVLVSVPADPHRFSDTDRAVGHFRRYTDEALTELLRAAGLERIRLRRYGFPLGYVLEDVRNAIVSRRSAADGAVPMEERSHGSGRLLQPRHSWEGVVRSALTWPFALWQNACPTKGPCLVATARVPGRSTTTGS